MIMYFGVENVTGVDKLFNHCIRSLLPFDVLITYYGLHPSTKWPGTPVKFEYVKEQKAKKCKK